MNYSELSDFEINERVAKLWCKNYDTVTQFGDTQMVCVDSISSMEIKDYCNNPSDAWPIVVENEISLIRDTSTNDVWEAVLMGWYTCLGFESKHGDDYCYIDQNPLRAAMICFLMIKEVENE